MKKKYVLFNVLLLTMSALLNGMDDNVKKRKTPGEAKSMSRNTDSKEEPKIKSKRKNEKSCDCCDLVIGWWVGEMREHARRLALERMKKRV